VFPMKCQSHLAGDLRLDGRVHHVDDWQRL
jgi:hypothetical protein